MSQGGARPGAGRPKGSLDKGNKAIREMIVCALDDLGGVEYLKSTATSHPQAFLALIGKVLPLQIEGGDPDKPVTVTRVELVPLGSSAGSATCAAAKWD